MNHLESKAKVIALIKTLGAFALSEPNVATHLAVEPWVVTELVAEATELVEQLE